MNKYDGISVGLREIQEFLMSCEYLLERLIGASYIIDSDGEAYPNEALINSQLEDEVSQFIVKIGKIVKEMEVAYDK